MRKSIYFAFALLVAIASCTLERPADVPDEGDIDPTITLVAESGNGQMGVAGEPLAMPLVVLVQNGSGERIENFTVDFAVKSGGGTLSESAVRTDVLGHARTTLTLGDVVGENVVEALGAGTNARVEFTTRGNPGPVASLELAAETTSATVGTSVGLTVTSLDQHGNVVPGVEVTLTATEGLLTASLVTTGDNGQATASVGLLNATGTTHVDAMATGASPGAVDITRVASTASQLTVVSGGGQIGLAGAALAQPLVVRVRDMYGNLVQGAAVNFAVTSGVATVQTTPSDAQGLARATVTLGMSYTPVTVQATIGTATPVTMSVRPRSFASKTDVTSGQSYNPVNLASADMNKDGKPDLVMCTTYMYIDVLLNTTANNATTPTFAAPYELSGSYYCTSLAVGDVTGDGKPDIIAAHSDYVAYLYPNTTADNAATPSFGNAVNLSGYYWSDVELADMDSDGKLDIVGSSHSYGRVRWLRNVTTDPAAPSFDESYVNLNDLGQLAVADVNGDGKPDVVVGHNSAATVSVLLNTITNPDDEGFSLTPAIQFTVAAIPRSIALRDLNGDNKADIVAINSTGNTVSVLRNTTVINATTPAFAAKVDYATGVTPNALAVADMNKDNKPDLLVANQTANTVSVLLNTSTTTTTTFATKYDLPTGTAPNGVIAADLNGDTFLDIAASNGSVRTASIMLSR